MKKILPQPQLFCLLISLCCFSIAQAQTQAQTDSTTIHSNSFKDFYLLIPGTEILHADSSTLPTFIQFYDPITRLNTGDPRSGNPGAASFSFFNSQTDFKFFQDGFHQFDNYILEPTYITFFSKNRRSTNINYHLGSKKEQHILLTHKQQLQKGLFAGLTFGALSSPGDFARQLNKNRNFQIYTGFESSSQRYRLFLSYTSNKIENQENGGITADSVFEEASDLNTKTLPIALTGALTTHRTRDYFLKQEFNLSKIFSAKDTTQSSDDFNSNDLILSHTSWWSRKSVEFENSTADTSFFNTVFEDSTATHDSSFYYDGCHQLLLSYKFGTGTTGALKLGGGYEYQDAHYRTDSVHSDRFVGAAVVSADFTTQKFRSSLMLRNALNSRYSGIFDVRWNFFYTPASQKFNTWATIQFSKKISSFKDQLYVSNHFRWENDFDPVSVASLQAGAVFEPLNFKLEGNWMSVDRLIYYGNDAAPLQLSKAIQYFSMKAMHTIKFGRFGADNLLRLQQTSNQDVVHLPALALISSLYYHNIFFKNALRFRVGIDATFTSSRELYRYMPATGVFYEGTGKKAGNYPILDLVSIFRIGNADIFVKLEHFNAGLSSRSYYGAYLHPLTGRAFKFGVSWDLTD